MTVIASDIDVLVELEAAQLLGACVGLSAGFAVCDLLYRRELALYGGPQLVQRGLQVVELTGAEVRTAQSLRTTHRGLSLPDAFACALAAARDWTILTGNVDVIAIARAQELTTVGLLWIVDELNNARAVASGVLVTALQALAAHPRCRFSKAEIQSCLDRCSRER